MVNIGFFSHYKGDDSKEAEISKIRRRRHLLVTGLFFDKNKFNTIEKRKFESEIFLQINNEHKSVNPQLLQYIKSLNDPYSSIGIANKVLEYMNKVHPFFGLLKTSSLVKGGITTPSILKYGLESLVAIESNESNLYTFWTREFGLPIKDNENLEIYIKYCGKNITQFFSAVKDASKVEWNDKKLKESKILSVTSIVGFIRAYKRSLELFDGPQNFAFYRQKFNSINLKYENYKSSHWNDLANDIETQCWR